ncbi:MAG: M23 family metallopeptidase, partial [Bacteroidales bacterium]
KVSVPFLVSILISLVIFFGFNLFLSWDFSKHALEKLKLSRLEKENSYLEAKLGDLNSAISGLKTQMADLIQKEKNVRTVFGLPDIDPQIRELGIGGPTSGQSAGTGPQINRMDLAEFDLEKLVRQARFEKENFESIYSDLTQRKEFLDHTPSITPTSGYLSCGFGYRVDPFTGINQLHSGVDLATDIGTPVYATANGLVCSVERDVGLGRVIKIDHQYGYVTVYGHLSQIGVTLGQKVKRGDLIGTVGNTGLTTGPHLHYQINKYGQPTPAINFFNSDISQEEFNEMIEAFESKSKYR